MSATPRRDIPGIVGAAILIVIGAIAIYHTRDFSPLGSVFPRTIGAAMILFAAVYIVVALARPQPAKLPERGSPWRRTLLVVVLVAWAMLLEPVGFLSTSVVAYVAIMLIANFDRWTPRRAVGYALSGAIVLGGLYGIFRFVLKVPLPPGFLL
jgi:putative tricarboxylic transport membrane protein